MPLPDLIARYREHGLLFGGGLLAGLLMFLIWLSLQPPRKVEAPAEAGTTTAGARGGPSRPADGVLGDFTAGAGPAADSAVIDLPTPDTLFNPQPDELEYAQRVVAAFDEAQARGDGSVAVGGQLVDLPIVMRAQRLLEINDRLQEA